MLFSDEEIALARENVAKYPTAKAVADKIIKSADVWLNWSDADIRFLLTDSSVPRAFAVSASGCPVCGAKIKEHGGDYAWIMDPKKPFKLKCPVDGTEFPSNDFETYYRSGYKTKNGWDGKFVDDGWGYKSPGGEKFWFVAYYNHWIWHKYLVPASKELGEAYLLTGDKRYAHKAAVMCERIAEVYPGMDHAKQSRYGQMMAARGADYPGKVVNAIWETQLSSNVAQAYDMIWETIDGDETLQKDTGRTGEQIRSLFEAGFLEDAVNAYYEGKIRGNFGMHQSALLNIGLTRQFGEQDKWFDGLLEGSGSEADHEVMGINYALYNMVYRDGFPQETSPGYNFLWVAKFADIGREMKKTGRDLFALPKLKRVFDAPLDQVVIGKFTPSLGDAGGVNGFIEARNANTYQTAYLVYKDPRYARWLASFGATGEKSFQYFETLFEPMVEASGEDAAPQSRLFDGYGMAILNNPKNTVGMSLYYGMKGGHGHFDRLAFDLFANGMPMMPDLGYPDAMNEFVAGIYTWSKNTISHNTVVIDAKRQIENRAGVVNWFADSPFARCVDIEAKETYPQCGSYRRDLVMVDVDADHSYFVDFFTANGGKEQDYSLHGPVGKFEAIGGKWSEPAAGTLAGTNVGVGSIYDDPKMAAKDYKGGFSQYAGSGFQHLIHVQKLERGDWIGQWTAAKNKSAKLRVRVLGQEGQQIMLADARVSPTKDPDLLKYVIARKEGENAKGRFISVIEPFDSRPLIKSARSEENAVIVERMDGLTDVVIYNPDGKKFEVAEFGISTDAKQGVFTLDASKNMHRSFAVSGRSAIDGTVDSIDPNKSIVRVKLAAGARVDPAALVGRVAHFVNEFHRTAHPVVAARLASDELELEMKDDLIVGRAKIKQVAAQTIKTDSPLPLASTYRGAYVGTKDGSFLVQVRDANKSGIECAKSLPDDSPLKKGGEAWIMDVGTGDRLEVPKIAWKE